MATKKKMISDWRLAISNHRQSLISNLQSQSPPRLLAAMTLMAALVFASYAVARHERLNSTVYDLGIKSQVIWNTYQGRFMASSIEVDHYFGDHVQLIFLLLAPLFGLWANVNVLLITQSLLLALGAIPAYRLARRHLQSERMGLLFAAAYLLTPTVGFVNRFDFHPLVFVMPFLLASLDFLQAKRPFLATLFVLLALTCREDVGITVFAYGLYVALGQRQWKLGLTWAIVGLVWSYTTMFVVIPAFRGAASDSLARYGWLGDSPGTILTTLLIQPGMVASTILLDPIRRAFLFKLFLPTGFLSLLSPAALVALPVLGYNLLSSVPSQSSIYFQYITPAIPFLLLATIQTTARLRGRWGNAPIWLLLTGLAIAWLLDNPFTTPINDPFYPVYGLEQVSPKRPFTAAAALLPPNAPVATMMNYGTHLALRPEYYLFYDREKLFDRPFGFPQSDYLLLNLTDLRWGVNTRLFYAAVETAIGQFGYEAIFFEEDVVLLTRTTPQPATGAVLQRVIDLQEAGGKFAPSAQETLGWMGGQWVVAEMPQTAVSYPLTFDNHINLLGYQITPPPHVPGAPLCTTLYWQATAPVNGDDTVFLHLTAADGFVLAQRDSSPSFGFNPTSRWQLGTIIADMHCLQIPPQLSAGTGYGLNSGFYDPNSGQRRLLLRGGPEVAAGAVQIATLEIR